MSTKLRVLWMLVFIVLMAGTVRVTWMGEYGLALIATALIFYGDRIATALETKP